MFKWHTSKLLFWSFSFIKLKSVAGVYRGEYIQAYVSLPNHFYRVIHLFRTVKKTTHSATIVKLKIVMVIPVRMGDGDWFSLKEMKNALEARK